MNTLHIFKKEMRNYFGSSVAYVFFAFFLLIVGLFFALSMIQYSNYSAMAAQNMGMMEKFNPRDVILSPIYNLMGFLFVFLIPVLTMRLFSEERKLGTIELLFTYPVTELQMVLGKFLASVSVLVVIFGVSFSYIVIYAKYFSPTPWSVIGAGYLGLFLVSMAFLAFGMWISSLTSDQVTSALGTVGGLLIFWICGSAKVYLTGFWGTLFEQLSLSEHFQNFAKGVIDTHDVVYFVVFIIFFVFLTVQMLETRKWKG